MSTITETTTPDPAVPEAPPPKPPRIDWERAAELLVEGGKPAEVAAAIGVDTARLWRQLRRSLRFRHYIRRHVERCRLVLQLHVASGAALPPLNAQDMPQWLAEAAGLTDDVVDRRERDRKPREKGYDATERLGETGARPPNQAFRKRLAEEQKLIDAKFAANRLAFLTAYTDHLRQRLAEAEKTAAQAPAQAPAQATGPQSPPKPEPERKPAEAALSADKPESDPNRPESDSNRTKLDPNGLKSDSNRTGTDSNRPKSGTGAPRADWRRLAYTPPRWDSDPPPSRASVYRSVIALPGNESEGDDLSE